MRKFLMAAVIVSAVFLNCSSKDLPEGAVAVVNKTTITEEEFNQELDLFKGQYEAQGMTVSEGDLEMIKPQLLDSLIIKVLLLDKAEDLKITPDEDAIASQIEGFKQQFGSEEAFIEELKSNNFTEEKLLADRREQSVIQQVIEQEVYNKIEIDEERIKTYYEENKNVLQLPESVEASHILIMVNEERTEADALSKIQSIKAEIDGGLDFGEAALEYSEGPSNVQKGSLGQFGRGQMVPEFETVAFDQEVGVVSDPVLTQFGYHLILTTAKNEAETADYEEVKGYIEQQMSKEESNAKASEYIEEIKKKANIILPEWALPKEEEEGVSLQTTGG
jgi:peptidyl-prolyl cis-trans isomerase C